ncbi:related to ERV1 - mitochondrial biogenesis and regulation of cell cycle [Melanopsichium pennsylvanicum]|uniref:Sulfhydryl oxidase n=2 Tax=Melanopsichium pennsylvanicum TaxID=63383 RepID=A0AAJ4XKY6_9BASI|nr:related to ERV1-mitochondrial biogenesis and regulation of cell cycle [Melanopsichium pennsylvanicum 4]SNX83681.1 related to ERV1 - mitochondrial biogenesis and regulation of cell cycle [Melanopsichium pennsylvanicum]
MPTFDSKPLRKSNSVLARLAPQVRRRPLLFFGLPFLATIVGASFGLANLTQTRYDYNATKVQTITKQEELRMKKDRKRIDIREEYFRLQAKQDELEDWEPKRIERPEGVADWGVAPTNYRSIQNESLTGQDAANEKSQGFTAANVGSSRKQPQVVLGPDGKPCRACNSKLAFAAAMKGAKVPPNTSSPSQKPPTSAGSTSATAAASAASAAAAASLASSSPPSEKECPPDGEELGRSTWILLHSAAAYFPEDPSAHQQSSMLALFRALPHVYPCHSCAEALGEEYQREEREGGWEDSKLRLVEAVKSGSGLRKWLCGIHNEVNSRLGKPKFDCSEDKLKERWFEGPADGSCD